MHNLGTGEVIPWLARLDGVCTFISGGALLVVCPGWDVPTVWPWWDVPVSVWLGWDVLSVGSMPGLAGAVSAPVGEHTILEVSGGSMISVLLWLSVWPGWDVPASV